tara:strand:- start:965 stop:2002 length:1038 start_codon:yes stop_codon:yes gene_type:complete
MSFVQDNIDRFNRIHSDYNNIANQIGNLTKRDPDNDLKNKIEAIGSGTESGANLYLEGRKMVHEFKSRKLQKGLQSALKEAGETNAKHMLKNNQLLSDTLDKLRNNTSSAVETREPEVPTTRAPIPDRPLPEEANSREARKYLRRVKKLQQKATQSSESQTNDTPAEPQTPAETPSPQVAESATPQPAEAPPSETPTESTPQRARPPPREEVPETGGTDESPESLQEPRQISQSRGRTNNDVPEEDSGSTGRSVGGTLARDAESEGSTIARTAGTTAGLEEAGGVLDAIPGLDILGLALGAIGGITSAVAGAVPDKPEQADKPPKPLQVGGNFANTNIQAGGSTA